MKSVWIVALLTAAPALAQAQTGATGQPGASAQPRATAPSPGTIDRTLRPRPGPDPRDQILRDVFDGLIREVVTPPQRPAPPQEPFEPAEVEFPQPVPAPAPAPPLLRDLPAPPPPRRTPAPGPVADVGAQEPAAPVVREPRPQSEPTAPSAAVPEPPPETLPAAVAPSPAPSPIESAPDSVAPPAEPGAAAQATLGRVAFDWWPLALLLVLFVAAAAEWTRRQRRLARTRAALALEPRLDEPDGGFSTSPVEFAAPPLSIRCRLEEGVASA